MDDFYGATGMQNDCMELMKDAYYPKRKNRRLQKLANSVDESCRREFEKIKIKCDYEARVFDCRTVGVVGDERAYCYPVEIEFRNLRHGDNKEFTSKEERDLWRSLSVKITNEIKNIGRVTVVVGSRRKYKIFRVE